MLSAVGPKEGWCLLLRDFFAAEIYAKTTIEWRKNNELELIDYNLTLTPLNKVCVVFNQEMILWNVELKGFRCLLRGKSVMEKEKIAIIRWNEIAQFSLEWYLELNWEGRWWKCWK